MSKLALMSAVIGILALAAGDAYAHSGRSGRRSRVSVSVQFATPVRVRTHSRLHFQSVALVPVHQHHVTTVRVRSGRGRLVTRSSVVTLWPPHGPIRHRTATFGHPPLIEHHSVYCR